MAEASYQSSPIAKTLILLSRVALFSVSFNVNAEH